MPMPRSSFGRCATLALVCLTVCSPAFAYIDPNAGGLLFQLLAPLLAAVVGGWLFLRRWITYHVRRLWLKMLGRGEE